MIVTITGPSCAGKTTLESKLVEHGLSRAISTTTRPMREGEVDGKDYYFVSREAFETGLREGAYVEHVEFGGNYYGLSVCEVERLRDAGKPIVVVCEPVGQKQIAAWCKANEVPLYAVFVDNPMPVLARRFIARLSEEATYGLGIDEKTIDIYARRLCEMMTTEREWVEEAWGSERYNLRVIEFNEDACEVVVGIITFVTANEMQKVTT